RQREIVDAYALDAPALPAYPALQQFFDAIGEGMRTGNGVDVDQYFDAERAVEQVLATPGLQRFSRTERRGLGEGMKTGFKRVVNGQQITMDELTTRIRLVRDLGNGERLVYTSFRGDGFTVRMRWWVAGGETPRIYDFEDLSTGIRVSSLAAALLPSVPN